MDTEVNSLDYFINKRELTAVISFRGVIKSGSESVFLKCIEELKNENFQFIILNLQGVTDIETKMLPSFMKYKKALQESVSIIIFCMLEPEMEAFLLDNAVMDQSDVADTLISALQKIYTFSRN